MVIDTKQEQFAAYEIIFYINISCTDSITTLIRPHLAYSPWLRAKLCARVWNEYTKQVEDVVDAGPD